MDIAKCTKCSRHNNCNTEINTEDLPKIALVGNPNAGKSVIFNALSGFYAEVSNFPGTTVDISRAFIKEGELIDTPGAYSLGNYTEDEAITQKILQKTDIIINVINALTIERDLFLTQQLIDMGLPLIIVINQVDAAEKKGVQINFKKMQELTGVVVIPAIAIRNQGIFDILKNIREKKYTISCQTTPYVEDFLKTEKIPLCERFNKLTSVESKDSSSAEVKDEIYKERRIKIDAILNEIISEKEQKFDLSEVIGNLLFNPVIGITSAIFMLYVLYQFLGVFIAGNVVDYTSTKISEIYTPWIYELITSIIPVNFINEILVGQFGLLTMTVELVFGVILPLIISFYLFMAILEDSGYLPRLAILTDNTLSKIGLNGRAVIPIMLGLGCSCMGVITTRILGSKKERAIATAILGLTIPCSAQLGIIIALVAIAGGLKAWFIYLTTIFGIMVLSGTVLNKLLKGKTSDLIIDIPQMRLPLIANTLNKTAFRIINFIKEAVPMFLAGSLFVSILDQTGGLKLLQKLFSPIVTNFLHLPEEFANVFIMGIIRRDFGSAGLIEMAGLESGHSILNPIQILTAAIVVTLFVPCLAALIIIYKERGVKEASLIWIASFIIAIIVGAIIANLLPLFF